VGWVARVVKPALACFCKYTGRSWYAPEVYAGDKFNLLLCVGSRARLLRGAPEVSQCQLADRAASSRAHPSRYYLFDDPASLFLADKTIKLWRVQERAMRHVEEGNVRASAHGGRSAVSEVSMPVLSEPEPQVVAQPKRVFANAHTYHINSVAANSDGEHFLSADDLRINLWNFEHAKLSFNIVDMKPENMEDLTEVITAARFHPTECNQLLYSSSRGVIRVADMRSSALCDGAKAIEIQPDDGQRSYYSEIIASISDVRFVPDGRHIVARDYLTIRLFDVRMAAQAVEVIPVHERLRSKLGDLYENDSIFDKFEVCASPHSSHFVTGSYSNGLHVFDTTRKTDTQIRLDQHRARTPSVTPIARVGSAPAAGAHDTIDYARKVLHYSWHPEEDTLAIAGVNNLFIYNAKRNYEDAADGAIGKGGAGAGAGAGAGGGGEGKATGASRAAAAAPHGTGGTPSTGSGT